MQKYTKFGSLTIIYSFFSSFWFSGWYEQMFLTQKYKYFGSLAIISGYISSFWFSVRYNEQDHITSVTNTRTLLYQQTMIYQQNIAKSCMFQRKYIFKNRLARFALSQSYLHFLQFPTCRYKSSLIRPSWYHQYTWTNTRTYWTDKNIYQQKLRRTACFQRQIRKFRLAPLARNQLYVFN